MQPVGQSGSAPAEVVPGNGTKTSPLRESTAIECAFTFGRDTDCRMLSELSEMTSNARWPPSTPVAKKLFVAGSNQSSSEPEICVKLLTTEPAPLFPAGLSSTV